MAHDGAVGEDAGPGALHALADDGAHAEPLICADDVHVVRIVEVVTEDPEIADGISLQGLSAERQP